MAGNNDPGGGRLYRSPSDYFLRLTGVPLPPLPPLSDDESLALLSTNPEAKPWISGTRRGLSTILRLDDSDDKPDFLDEVDDSLSLPSSPPRSPASARESENGYTDVFNVEQSMTRVNTQIAIANPDTLTIANLPSVNNNSNNTTRTAPPLLGTTLSGTTLNSTPPTIAQIFGVPPSGTTLSGTSPMNSQTLCITPAVHRKEDMPTIRFIPANDPRSSRPPVHWEPIQRTLKTTDSVIRVGRYSERDLHMANTSANYVAPVGFKSKVVSRKHCEFWCVDRQWYVRDVGSSSGTLLNNVRLSHASRVSKEHPINDGDIIQLGIDFKGGEEAIFRCIKIRVQCNRDWQRGPNAFNTSTHRRLLNSEDRTRSDSSKKDEVGSNSTECSICLNPTAPCQALFIAPCGHAWHYKCIRSLLKDHQWPNFACPNCRFEVDLDADVDAPPEDTQLEEEVTDEEAEGYMDAVQEAGSDGEDNESSEVPEDAHTEVTRRVIPKDNPLGGGMMGHGGGASFSASLENDETRMDSNDGL